MQHSLFRIKAYISHTIRSVISRKGYGIHSPFAFDLVTNIINPENPSYFYCFDTIERLRRELLNNEKQVHNDKGDTCTIKRIARTSASSVRDGQLLFRLALHMQSKSIVELGTSLGIGTAYLAATHQNSNVLSIDHNLEIQEIARQNSLKLGLKNITYVSKSFDIALEDISNNLDLAFIDGHHDGNATLRYYDKLKGKTSTQSIFVFHDIHWSSDMNKAWKMIISDSKNSLTLESYNLGIVFFNLELSKQHYFV